MPVCNHSANPNKYSLIFSTQWNLKLQPPWTANWTGIIGRIWRHHDKSWWPSGKDLLSPWWQPVSFPCFPVIFSIPNTRSAIAHRIYVWYIYLTFTIKINQNVGNYTVRPIDPMGFLPILNSGYQRWCSCLESVAWDQLCTLLSLFFLGRFQINHIRALWWPRPRVYFVKGKVRTQKMASTKAWNLAWWMTCR